MVSPLSLLSGPAPDHSALTAALGPAVFNGKDSPKHQPLVKNRLSAVPRPSALGNLDRPVRRRRGMLALLWAKAVAGWGHGSHRSGAPEPPGVGMSQAGSAGTSCISGSVSSLQCWGSLWECVQPPVLQVRRRMASAPNLGDGCAPG